MWTLIWSFISSDLGKKVIGIGAIIIVVVGFSFYITSLKSDIQDEINLRKEAENNVVLISREYEILNSSYEQLEVDYVEQAQYNMIAMQILKDLHVKEIRFREKITKIKTEIKNVEPNEDGEISNILNDTLNALRLLD